MIRVMRTTFRPLWPAMRASLLLALLPAALILPMQASAEPDGRESVAAELARIDGEMPGRFGVYVKWLDDGLEVSHRADRAWYLASTIKVPLAVVVLQRVEAGELSLDQELVLAEADFVDGSGELLYADPGTRYTVDELLRNSIQDSDSTATDMLIRLLGEKSLNEHVSELVGAGELGPITTILQVRYDAYGEIHADVSRLNNMDLIALRNAGTYPQRYAALLDKLGVASDGVQAGSVPEAFQRYYQSGLNSGSLSAMGALLERLVDGELLNPENTERLLVYMRNVTTGNRRIKAGLPQNAVFAHKTGTQVDRACNVGILNPQSRAEAVVVAACAEDFGELREAEKAFERLGTVLNVR